MVAHHYYRDSGGSNVELTDRILRDGWSVVERAEEGAVGSSTMMIADPSMDIDIDAHRSYWIIEDESEADDDFLFGGFTGNQKISRGHQDELGYQPFGRTWLVQIDDKNAFWQRRAMIGSDCNRPHETDVARMAWLLATSEASIITDTSLVLGAGGTNMDKNDYRRQMLIQVEEDAAMVKGRNWWLTQRRVAGTPVVSAWYNRGSVTAYSSPLLLSNDPTDWVDDELADGTSLVWPIDDDAWMDRDGTRVYSGVVQEYEGGAVYRTRPSTATAFAKRDMISPGGNIRTKTKAIARAERQLDDCDTQDERITASVELPAAKATQLRAGMRVKFKATHLPGYSDFRWVRILQTTITPIAAGTRYVIGLILQGPGVAAPTVPAARWLLYTPFGGLDSGISIQASDDGSSWTTIADNAALAAGTTDPPNATPGTYQYLVEIPSADWQHRYWRIHYTGTTPPGLSFYSGVGHTCLRLLSEGSFSTVDRTGIPWKGVPFDWWIPAAAPYSGDADYSANVTGGPTLYTGTDPSAGTSATDRQGTGGFGINGGVFSGPLPVEGNWVFDLLA